MALLLLEQFHEDSTLISHMSRWHRTAMGSYYDQSASARANPFRRQRPGWQSLRLDIDGSPCAIPLYATSTADIAVGFWFRYAFDGSISGTQDYLRLVEDLTSTSMDTGSSKTNVAIARISTNANMYTRYWWSTSSTSELESRVYVNLFDRNWHWIEVRYKADQSTGILQTYVDGVQHINITGADTIKAGSPPTFGGFKYLLLGSDGSGNLDDAYFGDIIVYDSATSPTGCLTTSDFPLGQSYIQNLRPNAAGSNSGFTKPSAYSSNYLIHHSSRFDDSGGMLQATSNGATDSYGFQNMTGTPTIKATCLKVDAKRSGTDTHYVQGFAKQSASTSTSSSVEVPFTQTTEYAIEIPYDPATSTDWTASGINSAEFGFKYSTS